MRYWEDTMEGMVERGQICNVEPEHGPWPYMQSLPFTDMKPTHDIWEANNFVAKQFHDKWPEFVANLK